MGTGTFFSLSSAHCFQEQYIDILGTRGSNRYKNSRQMNNMESDDTESDDMGARI